MVMESFVALCAGIVLVYSGWRSRNRTLLLWGSNGFLAAAGIAGFLLAARTNTPLLFPVANFLLAIGGGCVWAAARIFAGKKAPIPIVVAGAFAGLAMDAIPAIRELTGIAAGVPLMIGAAYLLSAGATLLADQSERLVARWPVVGLLALHGGLLGAAGVGFVTGISEVDLLAPIGSLFGLIHFESIVFALGTAVFFLEMNKERSELANKVAAHTDGLTGIANRQGFMAAAERLLKRCRTGGQGFCVVMFDLDHFKAINDTFGHSAGDDVIRRFVRIARDAMRPGDVFGRLGGEEFAAAIPGADIDTGFVRADRIRLDFAKATFDFGDQVLMATVSGGVASDAALPLLTLLVEADAALYRAKASGRNRVARAAVSGTEKDRKLLRIA
jgi:diguanylate cyclase (GGDEF)-like protein